MNLKNLAIGLVSSLGLGVAVGATSIAVQNDNSVIEARADNTCVVRGTLKSLGVNNDWATGTSSGSSWSSSESQWKGIYVATGDVFKFVYNSEWLGYGALESDDIKAMFNSGDNLSVKETGYYNFYVKSSLKIYVSKVTSVSTCKIAGKLASKSLNNWSGVNFGTSSGGQIFENNVKVETDDEFKFIMNGDIWLGSKQLGNDDSKNLFTSSDNLKVKTAGYYNFYITLTGLYVTKTEQENVDDGAYLRGDWENGWSASGQRLMTSTGANTYSISNVILGAGGKVKVVTYYDGLVSYSEVGTVTSTNPTEYPANLDGGDVVVTNAGTYTVTVEQSGGVWNYTFTGTSNPNLEAADAFALAFKSAMQTNCPYTGDNKTTSDLKTAWEGQASNYNGLTPAAKGYLLDRDTTDGNISEFQERYDSIYGKYGATLSLTNFLSGGASSNRLSTSNRNTQVAPVILVATGITSIIAVGGYFFIKKKPF